MTTSEHDIKVGKVDLQDTLQLVTSQLQEGKQVVFVEKDYAHHKIYITSDLLETLGGYDAVNNQVRVSFDAVSELDKTKTRFYFGQHFKLEDQEGFWFDIHYPHGSHTPLEDTQDKFLQAIMEAAVEKMIANGLNSGELPPHDPEEYRKWLEDMFTVFMLSPDDSQG
jgi:hypothetical protein